MRRLLSPAPEDWSAATRYSWLLFRKAIKASYRDNIVGLAKGAAYSSLLAFFPVLTTIATILVQAEAGAVSRTLASFLFEVVPPGSEDLVRYNFTVRGQRPTWLLVVATMVATWAASGTMMTLMEGFRAAYRIPQGRSFIKQRLMAIALVFMSAVPVVAASTLLVFGRRIERWLMSMVGVISRGEDLRGSLVVLGLVGRYFVALSSIVLVTALLYYFGPNRKQIWSEMFPGATVAMAGWLVATAAFALYVRRIANYNVLYGSVGAVIALVVWMYLLAIVALFGCEVNAVRERLRAPV